MGALYCGDHELLLFTTIATPFTYLGILLFVEWVVVVKYL